MRFVIPVSIINAAHNPRYFGRQRDSTLYSWMADTYTVFAHKLISPAPSATACTSSTGCWPTRPASSPRWSTQTRRRLRDRLCPGLGAGLPVGTAAGRPARPAAVAHRPRGHYGPLNGLARNRINTRLITGNWDEVCRLTASLRAGTVIPLAILRTLQRGPSPSSLARGLAELGRVIKILHVLEYVHDPAYRRTIHHLLSRLARAVFHGQRGQLRRHYQIGQENQLDSLGIMINVIVL